VCTLPDLAAAVEEFGLGGRAVAAHCCSLAGRPPDIGRREAERLASVGVAVVVCPVSNLSLQGRRLGVRGVAPVRLLREASVTVGIGLDNLCDVVVAVGTPDPLRAAWLLAIVGHLTAEEDLEWLGRVVTVENRRICGLDPEPEPGTGEELVIEAESLGEAVALVPARWRKGASR
jgi:cytosine deaminase